jgi:hypothetical protein
MHDESIYRTQTEIQENPTDPQVVETSKMIESLLIDQLFPLLKVIMKDSDPMPLFGLKLISSILERNPLFAKLVKQSPGIFNSICDSYMVNH